MEKLTEIGFSQSDAIIIAMDVGSSQALVNDEYLNNFRYSKNKRLLALNFICNFYTGVLFEDSNNE
ncbi:MAG: hypothetical protein WBA59_11745 [Moheibacter sp.]